MFKYLIIGFLLISSADAVGQALKEKLYDCYITGQMEPWAGVLDQMKSEWRRTGDIDKLYDLTMAQYGYIGFNIIEENRNAARDVLKQAENNVEILLGYNDRWAEVYALSGALYGLKVGIDPYKTVFYGRRALNMNALALNIGPESPHTWMEKGNLELHKPSVFGKDISLAIEAYKRSIRLFEQRSELIHKNWLYLNTLVGLADAYRVAGLYAEADKIYRKILKAEPDIVWIRDRDYPAFKQKHGG